MRYIIFSDLHGNADALAELLRVEKPGGDRRFVFCGDVCGYYYESGRCVELLKSIEGLTAVRGNHDQYYLDCFDDRAKTEEMAKKYGSSYRIKDEAVRDYLRSLPLTRRIESDGRRIILQHGAPGDPLEGRLYPDTALPVGEAAVYLTGHTHYRMLRHVGGTVWLNPGSLGQPRDGNGFSYCELDTDGMRVCFHSLEVDTGGLIKRIRREDPDNEYLEEILYRRK